MEMRPEFRLLISLTHPNFESKQLQVEQTIADPDFNWMQFVSLVEWHRVTPQVYRHLQNFHTLLPDWVVDSIYKSAQYCQRQSLQQSAWLIKITRLLDAHQIRFISFKGVLLAKLLYDDFTRRQAKDIDILIAKDDLSQVEDLLVRQCGFKRMLPSLNASSSEFVFFDRCIKDRVYIHDQDNTMIELHWRFFNEQSILGVPFSDLIEQSDMLAFHQQKIAILGREHLWLYQTMHCCYAGWCRLHWITDIADMLVQLEVDWSELIKQSKTYSCENSLLIGILMAAQVYRLPVPDAILNELKQTYRQRISVDLAIRLLINSRHPTPFEVMLRLILCWSWREFLFQLFSRAAQSGLTLEFATHQSSVKKGMYFLFRPFSSIIRTLLIRVC